MDRARSVACSEHIWFTCLRRGLVHKPARPRALVASLVIRTTIAATATSCACSLVKCGITGTDEGFMFGFPDGQRRHRKSSVHRRRLIDLVR